LEMYESLKYKINEEEMDKYIARIKQDLSCGSKYGRPWPYGERPEHATRRIDWSRFRVREHRGNMPWYKRFDRDRGFINYDAMSEIQLHELLEDQNEDFIGAREGLISKLVHLRDEDSEFAEEIYRDSPDKYMDGRYNAR